MKEARARLRSFDKLARVAPLSALLLACTGTLSQPVGQAPSAGAPGAAGTGAGPAPTSDCDSATPAPAKPRIWRLTSAQLANTLRDQLGFVPSTLHDLPIDERLDGFANQASHLTIAPLLAETYFTMAEELGAKVVANPSSFGLACDLASLAPGKCLDDFISATGQKLWRRPLSTLEIANVSGLFATSAALAEGPSGGLKNVVLALFMSPQALHRTELGTVKDPGVVTQLTDYELASSLSYSLWNTAPDAELLTLASQGQLRDKTVLLAQAKRMFDTQAKSAPAMNAFLQQWLYLENLATKAKDPTRFPTVTSEFNADLGEELRLFSNSVLFDAGADRSFKTLLTANYTFVNARTAPLYGIQGVTGNELVRRDLDPTERRGVTSMLPFLWGHSSAEETNLVGRGAYFRNEVLCGRVSLPPAGVPDNARFAPQNSTGRQRLSIHATPACAGCHALFDGIGFALENYDSIGQYRTMDQGQVIDPTGTLPLPSGTDITFANYPDLIDKVVEKPDVYSCFATQFNSYVSGRDIPELDSCEKAAVVEQFAQAGYKVDQLVMAVVGSPTFGERKN